MSGYDPACGLSYGEWLRGKGVGFNPHGLARTERVIDEGHLQRVSATGRVTVEAYQTRQDDLGNRVRERSAEMGVSTGQDVVIRSPLLDHQSRITERRQA